MDFKFSCPACAQHIAAPREMAGSEAACPTCGASFIIPAAPPPPPPPRTLAARPAPSAPTPQPSAKADALAAKIRALGYTLTIPRKVELETAETALGDFLMFQERDFEDAFISLEGDEKIVFLKRPSPEKLRLIGDKLLTVIFDEDRDADEELGKIILRVAPEIRVRK